MKTLYLKDINNLTRIFTLERVTNTTDIPTSKYTFEIIVTKQGDGYGVSIGITFDKSSDPIWIRFEELLDHPGKLEGYNIPAEHVFCDDGEDVRETIWEAYLEDKAEATILLDTNYIIQLKIDSRQIEAVLSADDVIKLRSAA